MVCGRQARHQANTSMPIGGKSAVQRVLVPLRETVLALLNIVPARGAVSRRTLPPKRAEKRLTLREATQVHVKCRYFLPLPNNNCKERDRWERSTQS